MNMYLLRRKLYKVREDVPSMNDTATKQHFMTAIGTELNVIHTQFQYFRQLVSGDNTFTDQIEKHDVERLKKSFAALRAEVVELKED